MAGARGATNKARKARVKVGLAEVRQEVASWSRDRLELFAADTIWASAALRDQLCRKLALAASPEAGLERMVADIDDALDVGFVEWRQVDALIDKLRALLADVERMSEVAPDHAVRAIVHFVGEIGQVFDSVHDECELADFCTDLAKAAVTMATLSSTSGIWPVANKLLDVYLGDNYGRWDEVPEILSKVPLQRESRLSLAEVIEAKAAKLDQFEGSSLRAAAMRLRTARGPRQKLDRA